MVSQTEEGVPKEARKSEDNIIISDLTLHNILQPQLKKMTDQYKVMGGCKCCISAKIMHSYLFNWCGFHLKHLKDRSCNAQNIRSGELSSRLFQTYKNYVRSHVECLV